MRMPNGYGSIIKLKGNRRKPYQVRVTKGFTDEGKQKYMYLGYYMKKEEAMTALSEYNASPYDITKETITFSEVYKKWSKIHFEKVSESSRVNYTNAYNKYCKSLYKMRFKDIRLSHLQGVIDDSRKGYPTKRVIRTLFKVLFSFAMKNDIVDKDYSQYVDIGKRKGEKDKKPFTQGEIDKLFEYADKMPYVDTILIMIYTGLRVGELLEIKNENVHLDERYIIGGFKTEAGTNRTIPINKKIEPFIRKYYNPENEYLITNFKNQQMKYCNYRRERFDTIMKYLEMQHTPHECRHTFASLMDDAKANKLCVKLIIGHSSQDITEKVYTHKKLEQLIETIDMI